MDCVGIQPRLPGCIKLKNRDAWRIRVGVYRVIYEIEDDQLVVTVVEVGIDATCTVEHKRNRWPTM